MTTAMSYAGGMGMDESSGLGEHPIPDAYTPRSGNRGYSVTCYDLTLDYKVASNRLAATAIITLTVETTTNILVLDLRGLTASKVTINGGRVAKFTQNANKIRITLDAPAVEGSVVELTIRYSGNPRPNKSVWGEVGWEELDEGLIVASQPDGASSWFPCNDHPSNKASFRFDITADSPFVVVANGRLVDMTVKSSRTRWIYESSAPMATYLATLQVGRYTRAELPHGSIPFISYIPADIKVAFSADFSDQQRMLEVFEDAFGSFPFDRYTVVVADDDLEIPLEAQGISVFGRNHVDGHHGQDRLIAHELAHSWFGNSVTVSSWRDIWLHEGFACYAEWLWAEKGRGESAHALAREHWERLAAEPQDICIGNPGVDRMFDDRLYKRGALLVHALRLTLGDDTFFTMLREWTSRHALGSVSTADFIQHATEFGGPSIAPLINEWLFNLALPALPSSAAPR